jgi:hypothetical protein
MLTRDGGKPICRDVRNYSPPQGPKNILDGNGPGLHGDNYGNGQQPAGSQSSGMPGLGGDNCGVCGTQGKR